MKEQMSEAFEAWYQKTYVHFGQANFHLNSYGEYIDDDIEASWSAWKAALSAVPAQEPTEKDVAESITLLSAVIDAWENGTDCYDDFDGVSGSFIGKAFNLDDEIFKRCCSLLNRINPPRNVSQQPAQEPVKQDRWISIEERLPEVKVEGMEFFLVTTINLQTQKRSVFEAAFLNEMELCSDYSDPKPFSGWHSAKESNDYDGWYEPLGNGYCQVTHWMPLPLPPVKEVTE